MKALLLRLVQNDEGQDLIEYVLIGTLVSIAVVLGATALGTNLNTWYQNMQGNDVVGYLTEAPGLVRGATAPIDPRASFLTQIQLIR